MTYSTLVVFICSFVFICLKAFQQLNVTNYRWIATFLTTQIMAIAEIGIGAMVGFAAYDIKSSSGSVLELLAISTPYGLGGGLGCLLGMYLNKKIFKKRG